jgi:hypothetical protein
MSAPTPPDEPARPQPARNGTRIQEAWNSYLRDVVPHDAPAVQITESKRAFFAGAQALIQAVVAIGEDDVTEDQGVEILEDCQRELQAFLADVTGGRA